MNTLEKIQFNFQDYLMKTDPAIRQAIATPIRGSATERLSIYGEAYFLRLLEAMGLEFPALKNFLGKTAFDKLCIAYFTAYPSQHYSIRYAGTRMALFLTSYSEDKPYLRELAEFEISLSNALDAKDAPIKSVADLSTIPSEKWGEIIFTLHPSVTLHQFEWNIPQVWKNAIDKVRKRPIKKTSYAAAWRKGLLSFYSDHPESEHHLLLQVKAGKNFAELCQDLTTWYPKEEDAAQFAINTLVRWLNDEMISDMR